MTDGVTRITLSRLHPHYVYSFTVAAATSVGIGPYATAGSIRMPQDSEHACKHKAQLLFEATIIS
jgi:hypothetical protein